MGVLQLSCKRFQENPKTCATAFPDVRPSAAARLEGSSVKVLAAAAIGLVVGVLVSPSAARAEVPTQPQVTFPQQPVPSPSDALDPRAQVQELQRQISELHDSWDSLTPEPQPASGGTAGSGSDAVVVDAPVVRLTQDRAGLAALDSHQLLGVAMTLLR
jgi:hypothetical protein